MIKCWKRLATSLLFTLLMCIRDSNSYAETPCIAKEGKPLDCLKISECPILFKHLRRPVLATTAEILKRAHCGYDDQMPKVCCPRNEHKNLYLLPQHECGQYDAGKLIGAEEADLNEFPWMALLGYRVGKRTIFDCGGSLLNNKYVLTAAHCVTNKNLRGVRIGEHDIRQKKDCVVFFGEHQCSEDVQDFKVEKSIVHKNFVLEFYTNDIALLRLKGTVNMARANARPICLPTTPNLKELNLTNLNMTVAGWGITEDNKSSDVLRKVNVPIVSNEKCKTVRRHLTQKKLCAGELGRDSCFGDSGGPLISRQMVENNLVYMQFGIVSYGTGKCGGRKHGIYTRVTEYVDWVLDNLEP